MRVKRVKGLITIAFCSFFAFSLALFSAPKASANTKNMASVNVGVSVKEFIKLAVDTSSLVLEDGRGNVVITPDSSGTLITGSVNTAVTTNVLQGYTLSVLTRDASTAMTHSNPFVTTKIDATTSGASALSGNTWGFQKPGDATHWYPIGAANSSGTLIASKALDDAAYCADLDYPLNESGCNINTYDTYSVGFGANLTAGLPAGTYSNNVIFSAIANPDSTKYTLTFDPNGGLGTIAPRTILANSTVDLPTTGFVNRGLNISSWSLKPNPNAATPATDPVYTPGTNLAVSTLLSDAEAISGSPISPGDILTLYAIWSNEVTIQVIGGIIGTSGSTTSGSFDVGQTLALTANAPATGYHFSSWSKTGEGTFSSTTTNPTTFTVGSGDATITANNAANTYTINYAASNTGASCSVSGTPATYGQNVTLASSTCTKTGYTQDGWSTDASASTKDYNLGATLTTPNFTTTDGGSYTLYPHFVANIHNVTLNFGTTSCSSTVHPTAATGCKMADGRVWILGNSGNSLTWSTMFSGATGADGHEGTIKSGICPSGYSAPTIVDFDNLIRAYGGTEYTGARPGYLENTGIMYEILGLSGERIFWSSTEYNSTNAYRLNVYGSGSRSSNSNNKTNSYYALCYKEDDSPITSVSGAGTYGYGDTVTISAATKTGYHLSSWTVNSGGISAPSGNPATFTMPDADVSLTANAALNTFTLNYSANGGSGTTSSQTVTYGTNVTLRANSFTPPAGKKFSSWGTSTSGGTTYSPGQSVAPTTLKSNIATTHGGSVTLYAIWVNAYMQDTDACSTIPVGTTRTLIDSRDNQQYTVYRWPSSGTAGTNYPTSMPGYCIMTKDLSLGYVTGGSITKGSNLSLTTSTSAGSGTITYRSSSSSWSSTQSDSNTQYTNGPVSGKETYTSHSYYTFGAAKKVCSKGWLPPTNTQYNNIVTLAGGNTNAGYSAIVSAPYNFVLTGHFYTGGFSGNIGSDGTYFTSTQASSSNGYYLDFGPDRNGTNSLIVTPTQKARGLAVRCTRAP